MIWYGGQAQFQRLYIENWLGADSSIVLFCTAHRALGMHLIIHDLIRSLDSILDNIDNWTSYLRSFHGIAAYLGAAARIKRDLDWCQPPRTLKHVDFVTYLLSCASFGLLYQDNINEVSETTQYLLLMGANPSFKVPSFGLSAWEMFLVTLSKVAWSTDDINQVLREDGRKVRSEFSSVVAAAIPVFLSRGASTSVSIDIIWKLSTKNLLDGLFSWPRRHLGESGAISTKVSAQLILFWFAHRWGFEEAAWVPRVEDLEADDSLRVQGYHHEVSEVLDEFPRSWLADFYLSLALERLVQHKKLPQNVAQSFADFGRFSSRHIQEKATADSPNPGKIPIAASQARSRGDSTEDFNSIFRKCWPLAKFPIKIHIEYPGKNEDTLLSFEASDCVLMAVCERQLEFEKSLLSLYESSANEQQPEPDT